MAEQQVNGGDTQAAEAAFQNLVKQFQAITDAEERRTFFRAHPELARLFNPVNFH